MADRARVERWFSAPFAVPRLLVVGAYLETCAARLVLSRWTRPSYDDPKQLATAPFHLILQLLLPFLQSRCPRLPVVCTLRNR